MWPLGAPRDCRASQCSGPLLGTVTEAPASTIAKRRNILDEAHCLPALYLHEDCSACILSNWCHEIRGLQPSSDHSVVSSQPSFFV